MAATTRKRARWAKELLRELNLPVPEEERARRRSATRELRALRDRHAVIATDTTGEYVREIREDALTGA